MATFMRTIRESCLSALVEIEARIDFEDELPPLDVPALIQQMDDTWQLLQQALASATRGQLLEYGVKVRRTSRGAHKAKAGAVRMCE